MIDGYCADCERAQCCAGCGFTVKEDTTCMSCSAPVHNICSTQGKCQHCFWALSQIAPAVVDLGPMITCEFCDCRQFSATRTFCCSAGDHVLPQETTEVPEVLHDYIVAHAETLIKKGREINQLASMTAVGVHSRQGYRGGIHDMHGGKAFATVQGRIYHFDVFSNSNRSHPLLGDARSYLFLDTSSAATTERFDQVTVQAALRLRSILQRCNENIINWREDFGVADITFDQFLEFVQRMQDFRIHIPGNLENSDTSHQQLMLLYNVNGNVFARPSTVADVVQSISGRTKSIPFGDRKYEQYAYPLFDPLGKNGWFQSYGQYGRERFEDVKGNPLTLRKYLRYMFCQNKLHRFIPKLQQEWLLDMVSRSESMNQSVISQVMNASDMKRTATRNEVQRSADAKTAGKRCSIPASVRGSPAYRREKVDMGMAHVYRYGSPTLFLTITANPYWREIVDNLEIGHSWYDDPFLVNLVFYEKLNRLISDIKAGKYFGGRKAVYVQYSIEFQKRGIPHAHVLIRLEGEQPAQPSDVDELVSVHLPARCAADCGACRACKLHDAVSKHMWHRCYKDRCFAKKDSPDQCKYGFPFDTCRTSYIGTDGMWFMKRRTGEELVVSYNADLLLEYDCHMNVQVACGTRSIMYLRKYLSKGPDSITGLLLPEDATPDAQLNNFYESRSMSSAEAAWVACEFPFNHYDPSVQLLTLHLPGEQRVVFNEAEDVLEILDRAEKKTHIERYFERPDDLNDLLFEEYFSLYTVPGQEGAPRKRREPIVTIVRNVNYSDTEHFALYMLLKSLPTRSFEALKGMSLTFQEAAVEAGLIGSDSHAIHKSVLDELIQRHDSTENVLKYFVQVIMHDQRHFEVLFPTYWEYIVPRRYGAPTPVIRKSLSVEGLDIKEMFVNASDDLHELISRLPDFEDEDLGEFFVHTVPLIRLNEEQQRVYDTLVLQRTSSLAYINGCAGAGKTTLLNQLVRGFSETGERVLCSAFTGVAASLLSNGFTCHRMYGLPVEDDEVGAAGSEMMSNITPNCFMGRLIRRSTVMLIDELSMLRNGYFEEIKSLVERLHGCGRPWAGKIVVLAGDFRQQAPIVRTKDPAAGAAATIQASIKFSSAFSDFSTFKLETAVRFKDQKWAAFLLQIASGAGRRAPDSSTFGLTLVDIDAEYGVSSSIDLHQMAMTFDEPTAIQYLAPYHDAVRKFNEIQFNRFFPPSEVIEYEAYYTFHENIGLRAEEAFRSNMKNVPDHKLRLAIGCPVIILRNISIREGVANGVTATVVGMLPHAIEVLIPSTGKTFFLQRISFSLYVSGKKCGIRKQFPLAHAFALTVSRTQGKTCPEGYLLDIRLPCFQHGQLYVALSRAVDQRRITVLTATGTLQNVENVVYRELLPQ